MRNIEATGHIKKLAIMGGTFDPIHIGHLMTAEEVRNEFEIDQVIFIPTGHPPHKDAGRVTHSEHRYLMTVLATVENPHFNVSRIEIDRPGTTYTIDTIKKIKESYNPDVKIYFITGADAVHEILTWERVDELMKICEFVAVTRPGYKRQQLREKVEELKGSFECSVHYLEVPALAISSSDIRGRVEKYKPIQYLVPQAVEKYIQKFKLYSDKGN
ncbi:MAG TPA: nicotinate-nucleotide adenylyltransferase [Epulopiscium sp.]|nr:nicotinate-nucleotide adenylyltransferase [Candidatus Epulonipiscium sp.]